MGRLCMELVTLGTLVGSGAAPTAPTPCEDLGNDHARVDQKEQACPDPGDARGQTFEPGPCEQNVGTCSEPEKQALGELADCILPDAPEQSTPISAEERILGVG